MSKRISTFVTNGFADESMYCDFINKIKLDNCDEISVICLSRYFYQGLPVEETIESRIDKLKKAGAASVILLPKEIDYLDETSQIIAVSSFFMHNSTIDTLYLPFQGGSLLIMPISDVMMRTNRPLSHMESFVNGADEFLSLSNNSWNIRLFHNIRIYYNPVKTAIIEHSFPANTQPVLSSEKDYELFLQLKNQVNSIPENLVKNHINDIMYSTNARTDILLNMLSDNSTKTFSEIAKKLEATDLTPEAARCFLLTVINNYRLIDNSVGSLHGYVEHVEIV